MSEKPEEMYADFVRNYEGYWISEYKKVISEFLDDLKELEEWVPQIYRNLKKKWEEKLK